MQAEIGEAITVDYPVGKEDSIRWTEVDVFKSKSWPFKGLWSCSTSTIHDSSNTNLEFALAATAVAILSWGGPHDNSIGSNDPTFIRNVLY